MTDQQRPITPPPWLVQQWDEECDSRNNSEIDNTFDALQHFASKAARWGADQELEACVELLTCRYGEDSSIMNLLRAVRRPKPPSLKPPSLKEQALNALDEERAEMSIVNYKTIRAVLESLPS